MSFSIQTNVNSLIAQENLRVNSNFQSQTIQELTSGYRINSSGDDPAGLAIANSYRSSVAEVTQGVRNANDGISTLQIIDGGMNNISQMLDRLRTLATQSASDTFTGSRTVPNGEFQSLLGEIDRQAQAIGLNTGGQFATSLAVYVGGGKAAGTGAFNTANGTVNIGLTGSAVDARALGLTGFQAVGGTADIGDASTTSTVSQIVLNSANTTQVGGASTLYFAGPGFSDANKVAASINLSGVTDMDTLVAAVNAGIQAAGNGNSPAATAFKNANVVASAVTDANGTHLAFTSPTTAFQVQAGDVMANAFLGNVTGTTGNAIASTVTGGATEAATAAIVLPVASATNAHGQSLNVTVNNVTTAVTLQAGSTTAAAAATDVAAAGVGNGFTASYDGTNLTINATGAGAQTVTVSDGAGQTGAATLGINNATASNAFNPANVTLQITGAGLTAPQNITFSTASTTAAAAIAELQTKVNSNAALQTAGITVGGSAGSPLVFTSYTGETFAVQVTGDTQNALGLGAFTTNTSTTNAPDYTTITGNTAYTPGTSYGNANLEFSVNGAGTTGNQVALNLSGGDATASTATATTAADLEGMAMTIGVAGGSLNSGPVAVAFGADTAATLTGTWANVAGTSLTINNGGGAQTVNFAATTGASATAASGSTWNNAVGQTLTYNTGAGGSVTNQTVTFAASPAATGATATATAGFGGVTNGQTLDYNTGSTGALAHTGVVTFSAAAATGASSGALAYSAVTTDALTYDTTGGGGGGSGTITFTTPADVYAAAAQIEAGSAGALNASVVGGQLVITSTNLGSAHSMVLGGAAAVVLGMTNPQTFNNGTAAQVLTANDEAGQITTQAGAYLNASVVAGNLVITSRNVGSTATTGTLLSLAGGSASLTGLGVVTAGADSVPLTAYGVAAQITAQAGTYLNATVNGAGALVITSKALGLANTMTVSGAAALTGIGVVTAGSNGDNTVALVKAAIAAQTTGLTVGGTSPVITITDATAITGTAHTLTIAGAAAGTLGLAGSNTGVAGADTAQQQATVINGTVGIEVNASVNASGKLVLTALDKGGHAITINDGPGATNLTGAAKALGFTTVLDTAVTTNTGTATSAQSVVNQLNNAFSQDAALQQAGLNAVNNSGVITIASANNTFFRMGTATSGANANLGFGVAYSTAQYGAGTVAAGAKMSTVDAQGVSSTHAITFAALADGSDDQALTISATDSSGALQSKTITLANDATAVRNGRNIDETVAYINTQLQQSANPTLQQIVAVKENNGSGEEINFLSGLGSFTVGVGSSANGNGLNTGAAETAAGNIVGTGSTISVDTQANALAAVTALSAAVSQLGSAQAAVGAGENQLNYSVGLAQSQIDNYSAAESRIRDADVAAEAANLTKAQVLQQTSLAAMAQANSAPQAVLALLRG